MLQTATPITALADAMIILKEIQSNGVDFFGGYRVLARLAVAEVIEERKQVRTTNAIERRFREVRRRTRPMGVFQDIASMDRIIYAIFTHENKSQGTGAPFALTHKC